MSIAETLIQRSGSKCELCSSTNSCSVYSLSSSAQVAENSIYICDKCLTLMQGPASLDMEHWRCLSESMWSEAAPVVVMSYKILQCLKSEVWAQDLLEQMYLDEEKLKLGESIKIFKQDDKTNSDETVPTKDSNGNILSEGDTVTLIKDLDVKGAGFTAKRGTIVRKISLTDNPLHIEGKVNGVQIVLVAAFLKKV
jgi:protein PhnA